jgi:Trk-type K+ transport system membrane component
MVKMIDKMPVKDHESKFIKGLKYIYNTFTGRSVPQTFLRLYLIVNIIAALLLMLPIAHQAGVEGISFVDALFTSVSAFSTTGLTVKTTSTYYSIFGQMIILFLIQVGGIGLMSLKVIFALLLNTRLSIRDRNLVSQERGTGRVGGSIKFFITSVQVVLAAELIIAILLGLRFYFGYFNNPAMPYFQNLGLLVWHAIFHAVSAVNNAGFDITGANSLAPYVGDIFVQALVVISLIIGGIGFPVFYELKNYFHAKKEKEVFHFSIFTKITVRVYFILAIVGLALTFGIELFNGTLLYSTEYSVLEKISMVVFHVFSTRNAGFSTIDINQFSESTRFMFTLLMWIGASPASTGGGIRTTTLLLGFLAIYAVSTKHYESNIFQRHIPKETIEKSLVVIFVAALLVSMSTFIILATNTNPNLNFNNVFFEVMSAFGTTGLSLGATRYLNTLGKFIIIITMFIGQQGITLTLLQWNVKKLSSVKPTFVEEDVLIS